MSARQLKMVSLLPQAVGIGMVISLIFVETIGVAAGGIVVPGYIALILHHPFRVLGTICCALITVCVIKLLSRVTILYGRRLLVMCILIGYLIGYMSRLHPMLDIAGERVEIAVIGYVIPGLMGYWMIRQGICYTLAAMLVVAVIVRLILIVITGGTILP